MDEGYIGGRRKGEPAPMRGGRQSHLSVVAGMVERNGGRIVARVDPMTKPSVRALVKEYVLPETIVFTDEAGAFHGIGTLTERYQHRRVNHLQKVYVSGDVHTNTIDGFWSLVKRGIGGVYHSVSAKYLQSYLDEYSFRYNRRDFGNLIFPHFCSGRVRWCLTSPRQKCSEIGLGKGRDVTDWLRGHVRSVARLCRKVNAMPISDKQLGDAFQAIAEHLNATDDSLSKLGAELTAVRMTLAVLMNPADPLQASKHIQTLQESFLQLDPNAAQRKKIAQAIEILKMIDKHGKPKEA